MNFLIYLSFLILFLLLINYFFIKKNFLVSETGDRHQKFASEKKVPLTGGIFLFLSFLFLFTIRFCHLFYFLF